MQNIVLSLENMQNIVLSLVFEISFLSSPEFTAQNNACSSRLSSQAFFRQRI